MSKLTLKNNIISYYEIGSFNTTLSKEGTRYYVSYSIGSNKGRIEYFDKIATDNSYNNYIYMIKKGDI